MSESYYQTIGSNTMLDDTETPLRITYALHCDFHNESVPSNVRDSLLNEMLLDISEYGDTWKTAEKILERIEQCYVEHPNDYIIPLSAKTPSGEPLHMEVIWTSDGCCGTGVFAIDKALSKLDCDTPNEQWVLSLDYQEDPRFDAVDLIEAPILLTFEDDNGIDLEGNVSWNILRNLIEDNMREILTPVMDAIVIGALC